MICVVLPRAGEECVGWTKNVELLEMEVADR